jgi:hypothetical protein
MRGRLVADANHWMQAVVVAVNVVVRCERE